MDEIEVEKGYGKEETIAKLRRLANALEAGEAFEIQVAGQRVYVPPTARIAFEFEQTEFEAELEVEIKWPRTRS